MDAGPLRFQPVVDGRSEVRLYWGYETLPAARPYSGWDLDDILLWGTR